MSSDECSSDSEDIPPVEECQRLCETFASITDTDVACAQFYLQDRKWDLDVSVNDFFEDRNNKGSLRVNSKNEAQVVLVVDGSSESLAAAATAVIAESALSRNSALSVAESKASSKPLKFITWNTDGLNEKNLLLRIKAVCKIAKLEQADIVFLQEVVPETAAHILKQLGDEYLCHFGGDVGYFIGTLTKKSTVSYKNHEIIDMGETRMMRNALKVEVVHDSVPLCLFNTHLESTADGSEQRKKQLKLMFKKILDEPDDKTVIFAGDMNLRDKELTELAGLPAGMEDLWVTCGSRKECTYTFDMTRNDNLEWNGRFKPRCRFDRAYIRHSSPCKLKPVYFGLIGLERLKPHRCFPSDHWGILCHFEKEK